MPNLFSDHTVVLAGYGFSADGPYLTINDLDEGTVGYVPVLRAHVLAAPAAAPALHRPHRPSNTRAEHVPAERGAAARRQGGHVPGMHRGDRLQPLVLLQQLHLAATTRVQPNAALRVPGVLRAELCEGGYLERNARHRAPARARRPRGARGRALHLRR